MPAPDREPRPWLPPSSNPSSPQTRPPPVIPALKRVHRNVVTDDMAYEAEVNMNPISGIKTSTSSSATLGESSTDATLPLLENSTLRSTVKQLMSVPNIKLLSEVQVQTARSVPAAADGIPLWPSTSPPPSPKPSPPPPKTDEPASPSQQQRPKASPLWTAPASKRGSAERRRQARTTEDEQLVEDARRQAARLSHRARETRPEERKHIQRTLRQNEEMIREIHKIEKTAAARASASKGAILSRTNSPVKKPSFHVGRGRTLEREVSRRRHLVMTESPKPHVGGKSSTAAVVKASTVTSSTKAVNTAAPGRLRVPPRSLVGSAFSIAAKAKAANLSKQRSGIIHKETRTLKPQEKVTTKRVASTSKGHAEGKPAIPSHIRKRSSAPSPEDLFVVTDGQKSQLELGGPTRKKPVVDEPSAVETSESCSVAPIDLFKSARETDNTVENEGQVDVLTRSGSSSWELPIYRPKTRGNRGNFAPPLRYISPVPIHDAHDEHNKKQRRNFSAECISVEAATMISPKVSRSIGIKESTVDHGFSTKPPIVFSKSRTLDHVYFARGLSVNAEALNDTDVFEADEAGNDRIFGVVPGALLPVGKPVPFDPESDEYHAEQMSPVDLSKVSGSTLHSGRLRNSAAVEKNTFENKLGGSKVAIDPQRYAFDSTLKLDRKSLEFQPDATSSLRGKSPVKERPPGIRHKRKGIKSVQWNVDLPLRLKKDVPESVASENSSRNASGTNPEKSDFQNLDSRSSRESGKDLADRSFYPELLPKAPLSCLTNSHRGRKLNVSFASEAEENMPGNFVAVDEGRKEGEEPAQISSISSDHASHGNAQASNPSTPFISDECVDKQVYSSGKIGDVVSSSPRVYQAADYEKAQQGVRKAIGHARVLLKSSFPAPSRPVDQLDYTIEIAHLNDAVNYILDVKMRFFYQPEIYYKFLRLLESCQHEPITAEYAVYVDTEVTKLFAGAPDLLEGYRRFRPTGKYSSSSRKTSITKNVSTIPVDPSEIRDMKQGSISAKSSTYNRSVERKTDTENQEEHLARVEDFGRLVESLRSSAKALGFQPDQTRPITAPAGSARGPKFNPAATEFKPLCGAFVPPGTLPYKPSAPKPQFSQIHAAGIFTSNQDNQIRNGGPSNNAGPIFAPANANGAMHAMGYHTMPTRMPTRVPVTTNRYFEALKKDLASAEHSQPAVLEKPVKMNGTTYYTMPKQGLPATATSLPTGLRNNYKKDCRLAFSKPGAPGYGGSLRTVPRKPHFEHKNHTDPLWMYTPLVPIRKSEASESMAQNADSSNKKNLDEGHGMEAKRLDDYIAKMKLDDFMSRFPMTGRKSQLVPNMKQKYAAEIQHRLELVLYEKKEKEAAAKKVLGHVQVSEPVQE